MAHEQKLHEEKPEKNPKKVQDKLLGFTVKDTIYCKIYSRFTVKFYCQDRVLP